METTERIQTEKRLATMEQKIDNIIDGVKNLRTTIDKVDYKLDNHIKRESEKYEKLDNKYSAKWVETGVIAITTALIIASIVGLFNFIIK